MSNKLDVMRPFLSLLRVENFKIYILIQNNDHNRGIKQVPIADVFNGAPRTLQ